MEIFQTNDFSEERLIGASSTEFEEFEYKYTPKNKYQIGDFSFWFFYLDDDLKTKEELENIYNRFFLLYSDEITIRTDDSYPHKAKLTKDTKLP